MKDKQVQEVHIGATCEASYLLEVDGITLRQAIEWIENESDFENMEDRFDVENFTSIIDRVQTVSFFGEDKSEPEIFRDYSKPKLKVFGFSVFDLIGTFSFFALGFFLMYGFGDFETGFLIASIAVSGFLIITSKLLISNKLPIPNLFVKFPKKLKDTEGTYTFEVVGEALVQMFIDSTSVEDGKAQALAVLGLEGGSQENTSFLNHFISMSELHGIYLYDTQLKSRISGNLVSPLRLKFLYSSFKYSMYGYGFGIGVTLIPLSLIYMFFG